ncbi:MAG TPA: hypothetical protein VKV17_18745 [Bryobacteraceae bacterium]|nr:hypothetical protein [Bryobacteraceae bacterium]
MKKAYQIDERRAIEKFRFHLLNDHGAIQMILPLAEIAQKLRNGVGQFLLQARLHGRERADVKEICRNYACALCCWTAWRSSSNTW